MSLFVLNDKIQKPSFNPNSTIEGQQSANRKDTFFINIPPPGSAFLLVCSAVAIRRIIYRKPIPESLSQLSPAVSFFLLPANSSSEEMIHLSRTPNSTSALGA